MPGVWAVIHPLLWSGFVKEDLWGSHPRTAGGRQRWRLTTWLAGVRCRGGMPRAQRAVLEAIFSCSASRGRVLGITVFIVLTCSWRGGLTRGRGRVGSVNFWGSVETPAGPRASH